MLTPLCVTLALDLAAAVIGVAAGRRGLTAVYGLSGAGAVLAAIAAALFLASHAGTPESGSLPLGLPWLGAHFRVDALTAFFLLVINGVAAATAVYGLSYGRHDPEPERVLPFFPTFLAGMNLVLIADDAFTFLVSWEFMSLSSWLLVLANHRQDGAARAALLYLVMASFGTSALLLAFGLMSGGVGAYDFAAMRAAPLGPWGSGLLFALMVIGAGSKAGLVPLHVWLPLAHPVAPSHVSALMSGVMTKVAVYGLIRVLFDLAGPPDWWWGVVLLLLGGLTALLGVLSAVLEQDLKRLLAYSTVENIGIITIGLGLALAFRANHLDGLAAVALVAALFHVLNHAIFKSLLFLGAGAVLVATGERDMERLGGLIHRMPVTAFTFLIGAAAISALPPLNGFASEWLTFQVILDGAILPQWLLKFAVPVVGGMLALAAALAGVAFLKAYGVVFLGRPRGPTAASAGEVGWLMLGPMAVLAGLAVLLGVLPEAALGLLRPVARALLPEGPAPLAASGWLYLAPLGEARSAYSGVVVLIAITLLTFLLVFAIHRLASNRLRRSAPWDCGFPDPRPETQYSAASFAQPIRRIFGSVVFGAREEIDMPAPGETRTARLTLRLRDPVMEGIYQPILRLLEWLTDHINVMQFLTIRRYLTLMFGALVLLLLLVAVSQQ